MSVPELFRRKAQPVLPTLRKEIVPWSRESLSFQRLGYIENPDPVLRHLARSDEEAYVMIERTESVIGAAKRHRVHTLLAEGSVVKPADNSQDAKDLASWTVSFLKRIKRWKTVQRLMLDAIFWGWRPLEALWDFGMEWGGRTWWGVDAIYEKHPAQFRFTEGRDLVYVGRGFGLDEVQVFDRDEDKLHWLTPSGGSTSNPYGLAVFREVWLLWYVKNRFMQTFSQGMQRSMGLIKAHHEAGGLDPRKPGARKTIAEIAEELKDVIRYLNAENVLVENLGWTLDFVTDVEFAEGWIAALEYMDALITMSITGETLTMNIRDKGSRALGEVHRKGLVDYARQDGHELEAWINDFLIIPAIELNHGSVPADLLPRWRSKIHKPFSIEGAQALFEMGAALDGAAIAEETGVPLADESDPDAVILKKKEPPPPAPPMIGAPGQPPPDGGDQEDDDEGGDDEEPPRSGSRATGDADLGTVDEVVSAEVDRVVREGSQAAERYFRALADSFLEHNPDPLAD